MPLPVAQVFTGAVSPDEFDGDFSLSGDAADIYLDYVIENKYWLDGHIYMMGITHPDGFRGDSAAFVQLARPTLLWLADWTCSRSHHPPEIPDPNLILQVALRAGPIRPREVNDLPRWVMLDNGMELGDIKIDSSGKTPIYRVSGTYVYGCANPSPIMVRNVQFGQPPWLSADDLQRNVPDELLTQGIIDTSGAR